MGWILVVRVLAMMGLRATIASSHYAFFSCHSCVRVCARVFVCLVGSSGEVQPQRHRCVPDHQHGRFQFGWEHSAELASGRERRLQCEVVEAGQKRGHRPQEPQGIVITLYLFPFPHMCSKLPSIIAANSRCYFEIILEETRKKEKSSSCWPCVCPSLCLLCVHTSNRRCAPANRQTQKVLANGAQLLCARKEPRRYFSTLLILDLRLSCSFSL